MNCCSPVESTYGTALRAAASTAGIPSRMNGPTVLMSADAPSRNSSRRADSPTSSTKRSASEGTVASFSGLRAPRRWGTPRFESSAATSLPVYPVAPSRAIMRLTQVLAEELERAHPRLPLGIGVVRSERVFLVAERVPRARVQVLGDVLAHAL